MPKLISTPAIILSTLVIREGDLISTVLSRELGVIKVYCRSAKRSQKRFGGGVDIFTCGVFELEQRKSELLELKSISERHSFESFRQDLSKFCLASFCLETAINLTHEGDTDAAHLFNPLYHVLNKIDEAPFSLTSFAVLVYFLLNALQVSGIDPFAQEAALPPDETSWSKLMLENNKPYIQNNKTIIANTICFLSSHAQHFTEKPFHTERDMLSALGAL
ncbi:MAG: DNA repair protein RecO [Deltaproteobacteria bacterium]|nr:DNA repair protein RecO [Deltaproteobacteria bacterium]